MNYFSIPGTPRRNINLREKTVINNVCGYFDVDFKSLQTRNRTAARVLPRMLIMVFLRNYCKYSLKAIGQLFYRDHTTVIHSEIAIKNRLDTDTEFRLIYSILETRIKGEL